MPWPSSTSCAVQHTFGESSKTNKDKHEFEKGLNHFEWGMDTNQYKKIKLSLILNKYLTFKLHNLTLLMTIKIKRAI